MCHTVSDAASRQFCPSIIGTAAVAMSKPHVSAVSVKYLTAAMQAVEYVSHRGYSVKSSCSACKYAQHCADRAVDNTLIVQSALW